MTLGILFITFYHFLLSLAINVYSKNLCKIMSKSLPHVTKQRKTTYSRHHLFYVLSAKKTNNDICHSVRSHRMITITTHYPRLRRAVATNHVLHWSITHRPPAITHGPLTNHFSPTATTVFNTTK